MPTIRLRLTGTDNDASDLMTAIHALDEIEHVEEVGDLMPYSEQEDSSSSGLTDDEGPGLHEIEVEAPDDDVAERVRNIADLISEKLGVPIEIVDEF